MTMRQEDVAVDSTLHAIHSRGAIAHQTPLDVRLGRLPIDCLFCALSFARLSRRLANISNVQRLRRRVSYSNCFGVREWSTCDLLSTQSATTAQSSDALTKDTCLPLSPSLHSSLSSRSSDTVHYYILDLYAPRWNGLEHIFSHFIHSFVYHDITILSLCFLSRYRTLLRGPTNLLFLSWSSPRSIDFAGLRSSGPPTFAS